MNLTDAEPIIDAGWEARSDLGAFARAAELEHAVGAALDALDTGEARVAEPKDGSWYVNQWLKKAVLLSFRLTPNGVMSGGPDGAVFYDKVGPKTQGWTGEDFRDAGFRMVPPAAVRRGAFIAKSAVLMPSYVNIGAYVGAGTMIDTWATVGSCAQIGADCHISGGTGIGGVLEPLQASPTIVEDGCFIGARSEVAEGVIVRTGAVISMGVFLGASTKIVNRATGEVTYGEVPPYSVVVPGTLPGKDGAPGLSCAVIVKQVDERTRSKTSVNELLRD